MNSLVGSSSGAVGLVDGVGSSVQFAQVSGVFCVVTGDLIVADLGNNVVRRVTSSGVKYFLL